MRSSRLPFALRLTLGLGLAGLTACLGTPPPSATGVTIAVAPLSLPGITKACYDIAVSTGPTSTVWSQGDVTRTNGGKDQATRLITAAADTTTVCSDDYGNDAGGAITYIGPCDATVDSNGGAAGVQNDVTIWIDGLYDAGGVDLGEWQDPCPPAGCKVSFDCNENEDSLAEFNLTVMREANQGFFDIAVNFQDLFCSAKLDTCYADGDDAGTAPDPIELLHGADSVRDWTAVFGFACSAGTDATSTNLLFGVVKVDCGAAGVFVLDPRVDSGNAQVTVGGKTLHYGVYRGDELLNCGGGAGSCQKRFWNLAVSLDDLQGLNAACTWSFSATANDNGEGFTAGLPTAAGLSYPYIDVAATLTTAGDTVGTATCQQHQLSATSSAVRTTYKGSVVGVEPAAMCSQYNGAVGPTGAVGACTVACLTTPSVCNDNDTCTTDTCTVAGCVNASNGSCPSCGDGFVNGTEQCDGGTNCTNCACDAPYTDVVGICGYCGDNAVNGNEQCDDSSGNCTACTCVAPSTPVGGICQTSSYGTFQSFGMDFRDGVASVELISGGGSTMLGWKYLENFDSNVNEQATNYSPYATTKSAGIYNFSTENPMNYLEFTLPSDFPSGGPFYVFVFGKTWDVNSIALRVNDGAIARQDGRITDAWTAALGPFTLAPGDKLRFSRTNSGGGMNLRSWRIGTTTGLPLDTPSGQAGVISSY